MNTELIRYETARRALAEAVRVDEVKEIKDKAQALQAYAKQAHDVDLETWAAEIKLRALRRLGLLSCELDKAHKTGRGKGKLQLPTGGKLKSQVLKEAGIATSTAHRCEEIASIPDEDFEHYLATKKAKRQPVHAKDVIQIFGRVLRRARADQRDAIGQASHVDLPTHGITRPLSVLKAEALARPEFGARVKAIEDLDRQIKEVEKRKWALIGQRAAERKKLDEAIAQFLPGVFIEECAPSERNEFLTEQELNEVIIPISRNVDWYKSGFEAGRERGAFSAKADVRDGHIFTFAQWRLDKKPPDEQHKPWAVEFPRLEDGRYVRRQFWFPSTHRVPD